MLKAAWISAEEVRVAMPAVEPAPVGAAADPEASPLPPPDPFAEEVRYSRCRMLSEVKSIRQNSAYTLSASDHLQKWEANSVWYTN